MKPSSDKPVLVFLRGLIRSRYHWLEFPERFAEDFQVIQPELPGNGYQYSQTTPSDIPSMMENIRAQVRAEHEGPITVIAVSMGAMIAAEWARQYPDEIESLHLINTSLANMSYPWERMTAGSFFRLLFCFGDRVRLERTIFDLTINRALTAGESAPWVRFADEHPLRWRNVFVQLIAASRYKGPTSAPVHDVFFYNAAGDRLVKPGCTARIAHRWKKPLLTHPSAGHDLPADDPSWLEHSIRAQLTQCTD